MAHRKDHELTDEEKQVIADEEEAERVYRAQRPASAPVPPPVPPPVPRQAPVAPPAPPPVPTPTPTGNQEPVAPDGTQILREVMVQDNDERPVTHYYVLGIGPPFAGLAQWIDIVTSKSTQEKRAEISRRLRGLAPDPVPQPQAAAT